MDGAGEGLPGAFSWGPDTSRPLPRLCSWSTGLLITNLALPSPWPWPWPWGQRRLVVPPRSLSFSILLSKPGPLFLGGLSRPPSPLRLGEGGSPGASSREEQRDELVSRGSEGEQRPS